MKMSTLSEMPLALEELQLAGHKESTLPKTLSNDELDEMIIAIDGYFFFHYNDLSFFDKKQQHEIEMFLDLRREISSRYDKLNKNLS